MSFLPCILCGRKLEKRTSRKNGKPYFVCDPCGIQLFIRRQQGIEKLEQVFKNIERAEIPFRIHARHLYEIQALSLIHISEPTRPLYISYAVFC